MKNELMVQGKQVEIAAVPNVRTFLADKAGITLPTVAKGDKGPATKEVVALCIAAGKTAEQIKLWRKELDAAREQHYVHSGMVVGMLAADPSIRKSIKVAKDSKGNVIGANATFRRERSKSTSLASENAQLRAQLAQLLALQAGAAKA